MSIGFAFGGPFEHLAIAIRVAERHHGPAANELVDADGLAGAIVDEINLRFFEKLRLAVAHLVFDNTAAADDLLRWNSINFWDPRTHELDATARDNESFELL